MTMTLLPPTAGLLLCVLMWPATTLQAQPQSPHPWITRRLPVETVETRILPPVGYARTGVADGSFAQWLRRLPVKPGRPAVLLFDGRSKANQDAHDAVLDLDVGPKDLQQCADAVMRLRAEWLYARGRQDEVSFTLTNGSVAAFARWAQGYRPVTGPRNTIRWVQSAGADGSYTSFRSYLEQVFIYAGSASLSQELTAVTDAAGIRAGDVFIRGGYPGHAVIVVDTADDAAGRRVFLLAQSFMPAQDIHVLRNPNDTVSSPWYSAEYGDRLITPEWVFVRTELRRFR